MTDCPLSERTYQRPMDLVGEAAQPLTESRPRFATLCAAVQLQVLGCAEGSKGRRESRVLTE